MDETASDLTEIEAEEGTEDTNRKYRVTKTVFRNYEFSLTDCNREISKFEANAAALLKDSQAMAEKAEMWKNRKKIINEKINEINR